MILSILQMVAGNAPPVGAAVPQPHPVTETTMEQVDEFECESVTVNVTVVLPELSTVPAGGFCVIVKLQSSYADTSDL